MSGSPCTPGSPESRVSIIVDDRERDPRVTRALQQRHEVQLAIKRLPVGDYQVDESFLFERKTLLDLTMSIKDGRVFAQGLRLAGAPMRSAIILEGRSSQLVRSGMRREAIQGALISLTLFLAIPLLRSIDPAETAGLILTAARQARAQASGALSRRGHRPRGKARTQNRILQGLPGIGPERARRLVQHFGSIEAVVQASPGALAEVPGIGATTAKAIRWAVEEPPADYLREIGEDEWPV